MLNHFENSNVNARNPNIASICPNIANNSPSFADLETNVNKSTLKLSNVFNVSANVDKISLKSLYLRSP